jgi:hypothetical protein
MMVREKAMMKSKETLFNCQRIINCLMLIRSVHQAELRIKSKAWLGKGRKKAQMMNKNNKLVCLRPKKEQLDM